MRLIFMGTPAFVVPVLEALNRTQEVEVVAVYTAPDRPAGRGRPLTAPPVKSYALVRGLPVYQPGSLRSARVQGELAALRPDLILIAAYGKLLPAEVLRAPTHGCLNLHPSLLPRYRGPSPVATAILEGATVSGITLMLLDEGMDTGPILAQREYTLSPGDTAEAVTAALFRLGVPLLENLVPWASGRLAASPQEESRATVTRKLERADGEVPWDLPAAALERRRRAFTPWPGLFTRWRGNTLKLLDVVALPGDAASAPPPGRVVPLMGLGAPVGVGTGQGVLGLKTLQMEGRRAVSSREFLLGYPTFVGSCLPS